MKYFLGFCYVNLRIEGEKWMDLNKIKNEII